MNSRRGTSTVITGLVALVAVLGTAVFFLQSNSNLLAGFENEQGQQQDLSIVQNEQTSAVENQQPTDSQSSVKEEAAGQATAQQAAIPQGYSIPQSSEMTLAEECEQYGISMTECSENAVLAKKRLAYAQQSSSFSNDGTIQVTNVHSWVSSTKATTAFVVKNSGPAGITIDSILLRGIEVPANSWWSTKGASSAQLQSPLPVSYTANTGTVTGISGTFTQGWISLNTGESAVVYMLGAGNMQSIDAGNTYALQVKAGQVGTVVQVQVITKN